MTTIQPATDQDRAAEITAGLRHLAAWVSEHPHLATDLRYSFDRWLVSVGHGDDDARAQMVAFARAGRASGATVTEHGNDRYAGVDVAFGPAVSLHVYADAIKVHGVTQRSVEQTDDGVTRRIVEYTPRSILAELDTTDDAASSPAA